MQATLHEMLLRDPGAATPTSTTPTAQHAAHRRRRSSPATPTGPARVMEEHCDDTAALLRGLLG